MILTATPLRVSLFGGGTDHTEWSHENGGAVLGMAINKYVFVGVKHMPPGQELTSGVPLKFRVQYSKVDDCNEIEQIKHPAVRAAFNYFKINTPLEVHIFGDLPGRSGLGGSSAFSVGLLHALIKLLKLPAALPDSGLEFARESIAFERSVIGEAVGLQDQIFAAAGGLQFIHFKKGGGTEVEPLHIEEWKHKALEESLVLVYTGRMRDASVMAQKQIERVKQNAETLQRMQQQAWAARDTLLSRFAAPLQIGHLLHGAWMLKRSLHPEMTAGPIDALYERALSLGAIGGKLLGAGGGGFMLFFVPPYRMQSFVANINAETVRFKVAPRGTHVVIGEDHL